MGLVNQVVPLNALKQEEVSWTRCIMTMGLPKAVPCLKAGLNAETGGMTGLQELVAQATGMGSIPGCLRGDLRFKPQKSSPLGEQGMLSEVQQGVGCQSCLENRGLTS